MKDQKTNTPQPYSQQLWEKGAKHQGEAWYARHLEALHTPHGGFETALVAMLQGWLLYADTHAHRFGAGIGTDYVLSGGWEAVAGGLLGLLNGETGRLDCGLIDGLIRDTLRAQGCGEEYEEG